MTPISPSITNEVSSSLAWGGATTPPAPPGPEQAKILKIISPAGFERYFKELAGVLSAGGPPDLERISEVAGRYGLTFHLEQVPDLLERHGLTMG